MMLGEPLRQSVSNKAIHSRNIDLKRGSVGPIISSKLSTKSV